MLAACAVANFLKIPFECVTKALENFNSFSHRFQSRVIKNNRGVIISDCYNANPESTRAALDAFKYYKWDGQKIIILGDMKELGIKERYWHRYIGRVVSKLSGVSKVITVGQLAKDINKVLPESLNSVWAQDWSGACNYLEDFLKNSPALVLIKASHSMSLDNITDHFCE
jgi:UDP-N-acetylmuramoyl-tripeptide--D-alanyl-D-alanine ligase